MKEQEQEGPFWYAVAVFLLILLAAAIQFRARDTTLFEDEVWAANLLQRGGVAPHTYNIAPLFYIKSLTPQR